MKYYLFNLQTTQEHNGFQDVVCFTNDPTKDVVDQKFEEWKSEQLTQLNNGELITSQSNDEISKDEALMLEVDITY